MTADRHSNGDRNSIQSSARQDSDDKQKATEQLVMDLRGQIDAISRSQMVIQFDLDGYILDANANFLEAMGYRLEEIRGKHHRIFVDPDYAASQAYRQFWASLNDGQFSRGEFLRIGKGNSKVWIQATYNPILDQQGKPCKVIKYATSINEQVHVIQAVRRSAQTLDVAAQELLGTSMQMGEVANQTSSQANTATTTTLKVNDSVKNMASASETLSASIRDMAQNATEAARIATEAVTTVGSTNRTVNRLGSSSAEIDQVVKLITSIAAQTNLLALNATIEAARAGEAGKGFAVVANEVKELARETANATEQISDKIEAIRGDATDAVAAIQEIAGTINQINEIQSGLAQSFENQAHTTGDILRNALQASQGTSDVASNIEQVAGSAHAAAGSSNRTRKSAEALATMATQLQALVSEFKY
ncbi:MAG: methyl-accepting chemotaxis protein [Alcanivorax sp.]|nr:methyl-accepting chemotaxis protein [Alcanivorax sp.]